MSEMSGEQMQAKIAAARRDAEGLKDKIKRKKDELADTSCESKNPPCVWSATLFIGQLDFSAPVFHMNGVH